MVRSVDVQQVLLQTNSVERVQQVQQQHPDVQQRYFEDRLSRQRKEHREKVNKAKEAESLIVGDEKSGRGSDGQSLDGEKGAGGERQEACGDAMFEDGDRGRTVDIKV
jgi:hypothetical protein